MKRNCLILVGAIAWAVLQVASPQFALADNADEQIQALKKMLVEQQKVIDGMKTQLEKISVEQQQAKIEKSAAPAATTASQQLAHPGQVQPIAPVTAEMVGQAIEAYDRQPTAKYALSGYGTVKYIGTQHKSDTFEADFNPILSFRLNDLIQFNSEVEILYRDDAADFDLEFATLDLFLLDNLIITAGKFVVPFNAFNERTHPAWINKMASFAPPYADENDGGRPGTLALMTAVGVEAHGGVEIEDSSMANYALYLTNGPRNVAADGETPELEFGSNLTDNNDNKSLGGRFGVIPFSGLEVGWSGVGGTYAADHSGFFQWGDDATFRVDGLELRGEYVNVKLDLPEGGSLTHDGYYAQTSFRGGLTSWSANWPTYIKKLEPVLRFGHANTNEGKFDQWAVGLVYWLAESAPLKVTYEFNDGEGSLGDDRMLVQISHGF